MIRFSTCQVVAAAFATSLSFSGSATAETITLTTLDGSMTLVGELQGTADGLIVIRTSVGEVTIPSRLVECHGAACPELGSEDDSVAVSGAQRLATRLVPALVLGFADVLDADVEQTPLQNGGASLRLLDFDGTPLASVEVDGGGDRTGFENLLSGGAAIALAERPISDAEAAMFASDGLGDMRAADREHVVALDALAVITSPENPVPDLTLPEVAAIFSGAITNWSDIGGPDAPIVAHARDDGSEDGEAFARMALAPNGVTLAAGALRHETDVELEAAVVSDRNAIGVVSLSSLHGARVLGLRDACGQVATPDAFAVKTEEYPLSRRMRLYSSARSMSSWAQDLIDFALSAEAQPIIADAGLVNQMIVEQPNDRMIDRLTLATSDPFVEFNIKHLRAFVAESQNASRISTTLRFKPDGAGLDAKALQDIPRLIDYLASQDLLGREVVLMGFTGPAGPSSTNYETSLDRANIALETLRGSIPPGALKGVEMRALGLGENAPSVCNERASGSAINDRVEVWLAEKG